MGGHIGPPLQGVLSVEGQVRKEWAMDSMEVPGKRAAEGGGPYEVAYRQKGSPGRRRTRTPYHQISGSGKSSWSIRHRTNPRSTQLRVGSHSGSADHSGAPPSCSARGDGPPNTRKGYTAAVSGRAANVGRRAAAPTGCSIGRKAVYFFFSFGPCTARFLFFFWQEKEKMGGAKNQPSSWLNSPPARKGEYNL